MPAITHPTAEKVERDTKRGTDRGTIGKCCLRILRPRACAHAHRDWDPDEPKWPSASSAQRGQCQQGGTHTHLPTPGCGLLRPCLGPHTRAWVPPETLPLGHLVWPPVGGNDSWVTAFYVQTGRLRTWLSRERSFVAQLLEALKTPQYAVRYL